MGNLLAIDPGNLESAWVIFDGSKVLAFGKEDNETLRTRLVEDAFPVDEFDHVAIEMIASMGMAVGQEVFSTCLWVGRFVERCESRALPVTLVYRREVKLHLCGSMRAKDPNIRAALIDKLGAPGTKKNPGATYGIAGDCWSALAVGVTWMETMGPKCADGQDCYGSPICMNCGGRSE